MQTDRVSMLAAIVVIRQSPYSNLGESDKSIPYIKFGSNRVINVYGRVSTKAN